jgi:hypothetical protein
MFLMVPEHPMMIKNVARNSIFRHRVMYVFILFSELFVLKFIMSSPKQK